MKSLTAENVVEETPLPHVKTPPLTPQLPLEDDIVKLEVVPDRVMVASVCVDQVPAVKRPPIEEPDWTAWMVARPGRSPGAVVPPLGGYLIPVEGQEPALGASKINP